MEKIPADGNQIRVLDVSLQVNSGKRLMFNARISLIVLAGGIAVGGLAQNANCDTAPVSSIVLSGTPEYEIQSFTADGTTYTQRDLIQPNLSAFVGNPENGLHIAVGYGATVPTVGNRSSLLTDDFYLNTGIVNPAHGANSATLSFTPPLVNGVGPDLIIFKTHSITRLPAHDLQVNVQGRTVIYAGDRFDRPLGAVLFDTYEPDDGSPGNGGVTANIHDLENNPYVKWQSYNESLFGLAIDLDDFGVASLDRVSTVNFGSRGIGNQAVDPMLFMGIKSVAIPEPATLALLATWVVLVAPRIRRQSC